MVEFLIKVVCGKSLQPGWISSDKSVIYGGIPSVGDVAVKLKHKDSESLNSYGLFSFKYGN